MHGMQRVGKEVTRLCVIHGWEIIAQPIDAVGAVDGQARACVHVNWSKSHVVSVYS